MTLTLLLYWFPIFLGVAVGTSLLGGLPRPRGTALALISAIFWIALVQSNLVEPFWHSAGYLFATLAGAGAIALMGVCGPEPKSSPTAPLIDRSPERIPPMTGVSAPQDDAHDLVFTPMTAALRQFESWLEAHRHHDDPWPDFDEFIRGVIYQWVGGTHVRTYRLLESGDHLVPLREMDADGPTESVSARKGVIGYVATTGRPYLAGDATHGDLIDHLAQGAAHQDSAAPAWCFAVTRRTARIGVVVVRHLRDPGAGPHGASRMRLGVGGLQRDSLRLAELLINQLWNSLLEVCRSRTAVTTDPGSGVLTRRAFFEIGDEAMAEAQRAAEPVAAAILTLEGLRSLDDEGQWHAADDVRSTASGVLKQRLRTDDRIGRFDDSRFVLLLRRVDSELATLIVRELMTQLAAVLRAREPHSHRVELRCGLAGSGVAGEASSRRRPTLRGLVASAIEACTEARRTSVPLACDLGISAESVMGTECSSSL